VTKKTIMKILVVDDNKKDRLLLEAVLRGYGYVVETAVNGAEALKKALAGKFEMIISDILMPQMDGFQLCRQVKTNERLKKMVFVFYTATYTAPKDEEFALSLGAQKFIVKPKEPEAFLEILSEVIKNHEAGLSVPPAPPPEEESIYLKQYNERLIKKLDDKLRELAKTHQDLVQKEKDVRQSREHFFQLFEGLNDAVYVFKPGDCFFAVNDKACELTGYGEEALLAKKLSDLASPGFAALDEGKAAQALQEGEAMWESEHLDQTGRAMPVEVNARRIRYFGETAILIIVRDISQRKKTEEALRMAEHEKAVILDAISEFLAYQDQDMKILWANRLAGESVNMGPEQLKGLYCHEIWYQRSEPCPDCPVLKALKTGRPEKGEIISRGGRIWLVNGYPVYDADKKHIMGVINVHTDITELKQAELALASEKARLAATLRAKERLAMTLRLIGDAVVTVNRGGRIVLLNKTAEDLTGWSQAEAADKPLAEVFHLVNEKTGEQCEDPVKKALEAGRAVDLPMHTLLIAKDGARKLMPATWCPYEIKRAIY